MELLLAVLSGLALWLLLIVLIVFLERIRKALAAIDVTMAKIAMGVRAIEVETAILPAALPITATTLTQITEGAEALAGILASADEHLGQLTRKES